MLEPLWNTVSNWSLRITKRKMVKTDLKLHAQDRREPLYLHLLGRLLGRPATPTAVVYVCHESFRRSKALKAAG